MTKKQQELINVLRKLVGLPPAPVLVPVRVRSSRALGRRSRS